MAIKVKVARTAKELSDVYKLRYRVYHGEEGLFQDNHSGYIIDVFDSIPNNINVVAYSDGEAVGTIRATVESELGTPSDESFDFSDYRARVREEARKKGAPDPVFISAGMLAIAEEWRNRRDVFRALLRMAVDVGHSMNVTHIIATVSDKTISIYKRLGWEILAEKVWIEEIGDHIFPVAVPLETMYAWAFNMVREQRNLLEHFSGCFQWYLLDGATTIFEQDSVGNEAYLIIKGAVDISCHYKDHPKPLSLAKLGEGDMFGELSLIDEAPRSATATTLSNCELLVINREVFWQKVHENPTYLRDLMSVLSSRLRVADQRALLYAYAPIEERLKYFVENLRQNAMPDLKTPDQLVAKVTVEELADMALASTQEASTYLQTLENDGEIVVEKRRIIFRK